MRSIFARRQPEVRAYRSGPREACRHIDGGPEGQRCHRTDAGNRHQTAADRIGTHRVEHHLVQLVEGGHELRPRTLHRLNQTRQRRPVGDQVENPLSTAARLCTGAAA